MHNRVTERSVRVVATQRVVGCPMHGLCATPHLVWSDLERQTVRLKASESSFSTAKAYEMSMRIKQK